MCPAEQSGSISLARRNKPHSPTPEPVVQMWYSAEIIDNQILATGKELKGYLGDIIRTMYTGEKFGTGDFLLTSDWHGLICKFK